MKPKKIVLLIFWLDKTIKRPSVPVTMDSGITIC